MQTINVKPSQIVADWSKNPRRKPEASEIKELAASIKRQGLLAPIIVTKIGDGYRVVAGYRRFEACKVAEVSEIPVNVITPATVVDGKPADTEAELFKLAVVENEQRKDLSTYEEAVSFQKLADSGMTQKEIGALVGKAQQTVGGLLAALKASADPAIMHPDILEVWKAQGSDMDSGSSGPYVPMAFLNSIGSRSLEEQAAWLKDQASGKPAKSAMDKNGKSPAKKRKALPRDAQVLDALSNLRAIGDGDVKGKDQDDARNYVLGASMYLIGFLKDPSLASNQIKALTEAVETDSFEEGLKDARAWTAGGEKNNPRIKRDKARTWNFGDFQIFPTVEEEPDADADGEGDDNDAE